MTQITACIFDLDGVIVDTAKYHYQAWHQLALKLDLPFNEQENEKMKGISRMDSLEMMLKLGDREYSDIDKQKYCAAKNTWYLDLVSDMDKSEILPGIVEFIDHLKKENIKIALGSASKNARRILALVGLTDSFDEIVDGNDVIKSKPDPEVFVKGAGLLGTKPQHTIVFEDSAKGIDAAIAGSFKTVGIGSPDHLGHADIVVENLVNTSIFDLSKRLESKS